MSRGRHPRIWCGDCMSSVGLVRGTRSWSCSPGTPERAVGRALPLRELVPVHARPCHRTEGGWLGSVRTTVVTGIVLHGECLQTPLCGPRKRDAHVFLKVLLVGGDGTQ